MEDEMRQELVEKLLAAAQEVVNDVDHEDGACVVDPEIMATLRGVVQQISDEAWQEIQAGVAADRG